ncbi:MAG: thioredoxin family protein [Proteobacteria bacterium]|nr:thioredoxin family protein [Pseudomonadota bacterium]
MFLDRDAFTLSYEPALVNLEQITQTITDLGYQPEVIIGGLQPLSPSPAVSGPIPEPLASTLTLAKEENKFVFIDFYAPWCGPCIIMEEMTLSDPVVKQSLESFVFLKVDTDVYPEVATHYNIIGMPTLIVVDSGGIEIWRQVGSISADELALQLNNL